MAKSHAESAIFVLTIPLSYQIVVRYGSLDQETPCLTMVGYGSEHAN
jgi:hypothetical protein